MTKAASNSDFDPDALTKKSDQHDKLLSALEKRVGTNENFGKTFADAAADSVSLRTAVATILNDLLEHDTKTQESVESVVDKIDKRKIKGQLITAGKMALWAISIIVTAILTNWVNNKH